jgi:hypothetical protein
MKKIVIISALLILVTASQAQDTIFQYYKGKEIKTLLGSGKPGGRYSSLSLGYSIINDKQALVFGHRISWLVGHSLGIGMGINGFINENHHVEEIDKNGFLLGGYAGFCMEPIVLSSFPVHISFPTLFGVGGVALRTDDEDRKIGDPIFEDSEAFLILEPGADIDLNLTKSFRLGFGVSYRFTSPFELSSSEDYRIDVKQLRTLTFKLTLKFGRF